MTRAILYQIGTTTRGAGGKPFSPRGVDLLGCEVETDGSVRVRFYGERNKSKHYPGRMEIVLAPNTMVFEDADAVSATSQSEKLPNENATPREGPFDIVVRDVPEGEWQVFVLSFDE